jgi:hypothetical protein
VPFRNGFAGLCSNEQRIVAEVLFHAGLRIFGGSHGNHMHYFHVAVGFSVFDQCAYDVCGFSYCMAEGYAIP